jgi:hypothetical protein
VRQGERDGLLRELTAVTNDVAGVRLLLARMRDLQSSRAWLSDDVQRSCLRLDTEILRMLLTAGATTGTGGAPQTYRLHLSTTCDLPDVTG